jgi:hypothetical protein
MEGTPMSRRLRRAVSMMLLALGALGLLATGSGVWPGSPWVWLAVLALAVLCQVAGDHYDQRLRLARRTERRLRGLAETVEQWRDILTRENHALRRDLDEHKVAVTPEALKHLHGVVEKMAKDVAPIVEEMQSLRAAGGLRSMVARR